jgi:hypothetical protein
VDKIVEETINQDMSLISGIPLIQMYFDRLIVRARNQQNYSPIYLS